MVILAYVNIFRVKNIRRNDVPIKRYIIMIISCSVHWMSLGISSYYGGQYLAYGTGLTVFNVLLKGITLAVILSPSSSLWRYILLWDLVSPKMFYNPLHSPVFRLFHLQSSFTQSVRLYWVKTKSTYKLYSFRRIFKWTVNNTTVKVGKNKGTNKESN